MLEQYGLTAGVQARTINFLWEQLSDSGSQMNYTVLAASAPWEISVDERRRAMVGVVESAIAIREEHKRPG